MKIKGEKSETCAYSGGQSISDFIFQKKDSAESVFPAEKFKITQFKWEKG